MDVQARGENMTSRFRVFWTVCLVFVSTWTLAAGLPKNSIQVLIKALQDPSVDVRSAAALALTQVPADLAVKPLETALIASSDAKEQDVLVKALIAQEETDSIKRLSDSLVNPQFTWGAGAKARAVEVIAKLGEKKSIKWLTDLAAGEQDAPIRAMAIRMLGELGAPAKKDKGDGR